MNFASPYAYCKHEAEAEHDVNQVDVLLAAGGLAVMAGDKVQSSSIQERASAPSRRRAAPRKSRRKMKMAKIRLAQADANVVSVKFDGLARDGDGLAAGDFVKCSNCPAIFNHLSKLTPKGGDNSGENEAKVDSSAQGEKEHVEVGQQVWTCEFCGHCNEVDIPQEEVPVKDTLDYIRFEDGFEDASVDQAGDGNDKQKKGEGEETVIFCLDISGSMGVTTEVKGKLELKGYRPPDHGLDLSMFNDIERPRMPRNVTYVSRLQAVQAAVATQVESLQLHNEKAKVGLVTFNREVVVVGDSSTAPVVVTGDKLQDQRKLQDIGAACAVGKPIESQANQLSDKIFSLENDGPTALGPAVVVALSMAAASPGGRVIVCTDGLANVGLGSLDNLQTDEEREAASNWYRGLGSLARATGTSVSVISIVGDECSLVDLGQLAEATGGSVDRVDPLELTTNFSAILAKPPIATHVKVTFLLHRALHVRNEEEESNLYTRDMGSVSEDSELLLEYGVRSAEANKMFEKLDQVPFQVQIEYTGKQGLKALRVITAAQKVTQEREVAEDEVNVNLLATNIAHQSAQLARRGKYSEARVNCMHQGVWLQNKTSVMKEKKKKSEKNKKGGFFSFMRSARAPCNGRPQQQQQQQQAPPAPQSEDVMDKFWNDMDQFSNQLQAEEDEEDEDEDEAPPQMALRQMALGAPSAGKPKRKKGKKKMARPSDAGYAGMSKMARYKLQ